MGCIIKNGMTQNNVDLNRPNTIQQDIDDHIAGNLLAGYSAGTILLLIKQQIRHYGQNASFDTMAYQRLSEYQMRPSFPLFKVNEP